MVKTRRLGAWLPVLAVLLGGVASAQRQQASQARKPDQICHLLFQTYLARPRKVNHSTILAASHIIAERARLNGFWRDVLRELRKSNRGTERRCVRLLGKMLATDGLARHILSSDQRKRVLRQWEPSIRLGPEVVEELLKRAKQRKGGPRGCYVIALARARAPETRAFLESLLSPGPGLSHPTGCGFHAAVGLAQLGCPRGFEWLIAQSDSRKFIHSKAAPAHGLPRNLGAWCVAALRELSGQSKLTTKAEWQAWWKNADRKALPKRMVRLVDY